MGVLARGIFCKIEEEKAYKQNVRKDNNPRHLNACASAMAESSARKHFGDGEELLIQLHFIKTMLRRVANVTLRQTKIWKWGSLRCDDANQGTKDSRSGRTRSIITRLIENWQFSSWLTLVLDHRGYFDQLPGLPSFDGRLWLASSRTSRSKCKDGYWLAF